jgi:hypothetical protein
MVNKKKMRITKDSVQKEMKSKVGNNILEMECRWSTYIKSNHNLVIITSGSSELSSFVRGSLYGKECR